MNRRSFFEILGTTAFGLGLSKDVNSQTKHGVEAKLKALGFSLPEAAKPVAVYVPYRISGNQVFIAGQIPPSDLDTPTYGKVGKELTLEEGYIAAQHVGLRILSQLKAACEGDLDRVSKCIQIRGFVNCTNDFTKQANVINGVSELLRDVFGDEGMGARAALGANALPLNASVEVESVFEIKV
ncbi:MAG: RidA family protein [Pseudomonadota bacterium]|nr:RidA family protein [Pseudomonadota bacterium]